jgi:DNA-binding NarL/FixJ family response regulator
MARNLPRVLIVDDHPVVRMGLRAMLEQSGRYAVAGEASTAAEAMRLAAHEQPEIMILDQMLGGVAAPTWRRSARLMAPIVPNSAG